MSYQDKWSSLQRNTLRIGLTPILSLGLLSLPSSITLPRAGSTDLLPAQSACANASSFESAENALAQGRVNEFLLSLEEALNFVETQGALSENDCSVQLIELSQYLSDELMQADLAETRRLAATVAGVRRLATFEGLAERRSDFLRDWLLQLNVLLRKLPESQIPIDQRIPVQTITIEAVQDIAVTLLKFESLENTAPLLVEALRYLQAYGLPDKTSSEAIENDEAADDSRQMLENLQISLQIAALKGIEAIGYTLFELEIDGGLVNPLQNVASRLQEELRDSNDNDLSTFSQLELTRRMATVQALAAVSSLQNAECSTDRDCGLLTLIRIIASPSLEGDSSNVEPLRVRAAAIAAIERLASVNPEQFQRTILPTLRLIAGTELDIDVTTVSDNTSNTESNEHVAVRTQAAEIASRMVIQLERLEDTAATSLESNTSSNESSALSIGDSSALLALLKEGIESDIEEVKLNAQSVFFQQYSGDLNQLSETIEQARRRKDQALLQTAIRAAGGGNYRRINQDQSNLQELTRVLALTLSDDFSDFEPADRAEVRGSAAFALGQIAPFRPDLIYLPNTSPQANSLISLLNTLSDSSPEVVVQASYALSQYGTTLKSHIKISETLEGLDIVPTSLTTSLDAAKTLEQLKICLLQIVERQNLPRLGTDQACIWVNELESIGSEEAAVAAAFVLGQISIEDREPVKQLIKILQTETSADLRESILVHSLSEISPTNVAAILPLIEFYEQEHWMSDTELSAEIMEVINAISPEAPEIVSAFVQVLNEQIFRQSSDFYTTQVLAANVIENIASKVKTPELFTDIEKLEDSLHTVKKIAFQRYLTSSNSSMIACVGIAFALAEIGLQVDDKIIVETLEKLYQDGIQSFSCQNNENLDLEEQDTQKELISAGVLSALGSLSSDHPSRTQALAALNSAITIENGIEINRAALRASKDFLLKSQHMEGTCETIGEQRKNQVLPICNLLIPFKEDFESLSKNNTESKILVQSIRAEALEQLSNLVRVIARWISVSIPCFRIEFDPGYSNYRGVPWSEFGTRDTDSRVPAGLITSFRIRTGVNTRLYAGALAARILRRKPLSRAAV